MRSPTPLDTRMAEPTRVPGKIFQAAPSSITMHRILTIPELVLNIFQNIITTKPDGVPRIDRVTLASLARCCRRFREPALESMYAEIRNLHWLIKCMPRDLWEDNGKKLVFLRNMNDHDWSIFCRYARYVKILYISVYQASQIDLGVYEQLGKYLIRFDSREALFPRLHTLQSNETSDQIVSLMWHLLKSRLTSLILMVSNGGILRCVLARLSPPPGISSPPDPPSPPLTTSLKTLGLSDSHRPGPDITDTICDTFKKFHHLTVVRCDKITESAAKHFSEMPSLQFLHFTMPKDLSFNSIRDNRPSEMFVALQRLHIHSETLDACLRFQHLTRSSSLRSITYTVDDERTADRWKEIFTSLAATPSYHDLSVLDLTELTFAGKDYTDEYILDFPKLKPLLQFKNLTRLKIETFCTFKLDNAAIKEMAQAWPRLLSLDLSYREDGWELEPEITLHGLLPLLRNCPGLQHLGIVVDGRYITANPHKLPGGGVRNTSLTTLWLADSPITRPPLVAAFLSSVAPNIRNIMSWDTEPLALRPRARKYKRRWKIVKRMIPVLSMARTQERNGCRGGGLDSDPEALLSESETDPEPAEDPMDESDDDD
ncbi:hypothetical protein BJ138DRAFT_323541 [Hygrophoropsis aurantiaca]|uniref:Uncharacterized protein n=1 Tax=Hygrophoropsis aurantiaca TaxID=72124 RepID=A0ACB8A5E8_9AGAM|nr:hypothetical protein BJ138DRAFT_323541 [Hygrophoropsis aurantiaca]